MINSSKLILALTLIALAALLVLMFASVLQTVTEERPLYMFSLAAGSVIVCERFVNTFVALWKR